MDQISHRDIPLGGTHRTSNWEYANEAARLAATGFTSGDVGKEAWQRDDNSFWVLAGHSPVDWQPKGGGGSGTVTSVAMTVPADLSVAGSPITGAGTLAVTRANQSANTVLAGPAAGGAATPAYRTLDAADIPALSYAPVSHAHSGADITSGTVAAARLPDASTTAKGVVELATDGESAALLAVQSNDSRMNNARTPTAHTHPEGDLALTDITTNNASTTKHGFLRKLSGTATEYLDGTGAFSTPAGGGGGGSVTPPVSAGALMNAYNNFR